MTTSTAIQITTVLNDLWNWNVHKVECHAIMVPFNAVKKNHTHLGLKCLPVTFSFVYEKVSRNGTTRKNLHFSKYDQTLSQQAPIGNQVTSVEILLIFERNRIGSEPNDAPRSGKTVPEGYKIDDFLSPPYRGTGWSAYFHFRMEIYFRCAFVVIFIIWFEMCNQNSLICNRRQMIILLDHFLFVFQPTNEETNLKGKMRRVWIL